MKEPIDPEEQKVLLPMLRAFRGWTQKALAHHAGLGHSTVRRYEEGAPMTRKSFQQLVEGTGLPFALVETCLLPAIRAGRASLEGAVALPETSEDAGLDGALAEARRAAFSALLVELSGGPAAAPKDAETSWEAKTWGFVERLCQESESLAPRDADKALKLAGMALRFAERAPGPAEQRKKLEAYASTVLGKAQRAAGSPPSGGEALPR
jgi:transcriptional regulator with XRE-family HTH domain